MVGSMNIFTGLWLMLLTGNCLNNIGQSKEGLYRDRLENEDRAAWTTFSDSQQSGNSKSSIHYVYDKQTKNHVIDFSFSLKTHCLFHIFRKSYLAHIMQVFSVAQRLYGYVPDLAEFDSKNDRKI
jgi:hypothetical protein